MARTLARLLLTVFFTRPTLRGREHMPAEPFILAVDHQAPIDPLVILATVPRPLCLLLPAEVFHVPLLGWVCWRAGLIGMRPRPIGLRAIRAAMRALCEERRPLALFVTAPAGPADGPPRLLASFLAAHTGLAVVPGHLEGTARLWPAGSLVPRYHRSVELCLGAPLPLGLSGRPARPDLLRATERIHAAIAGLAPAAVERGVFAGGST